MNILLILNDSPYTNERSYNGMRLAKTLAVEGVEVVVFLMADAVYCAKTSQQVPEGHINLERMLENFFRFGKVLMCGTCMDARGISDNELLKTASRSTMKELAQLTQDADKVLVF